MELPGRESKEEEELGWGKKEKRRQGDARHQTDMEETVAGHTE